MKKPISFFPSNSRGKRLARRLALELDRFENIEGIIERTWFHKNGQAAKLHLVEHREVKFEISKIMQESTICTPFITA